MPVIVYILWLIIWVVITALVLNHKQKKDFGILQIKELRVQQEKLNAEIDIIDMDIAELNKRLEDRINLKIQKEATRAEVIKQKEEIETAVYYLNKSLGRDRVEKPFSPDTTTGSNQTGWEIES